MDALRSTPHAMMRFRDQRLAASPRSNSARSWLALLMLLTGLPGCAALPGAQPRFARGCEVIPPDNLPIDADPAPCGPAAWPLPLRRLVPQQFAGADFRPACRCHDRCYECGGEDRAECDERFGDSLADACQSSGFPLLCRLVARGMHCSVTCLGGWFYRANACGPETGPTGTAGP
ncbi:MAG: hypothetical protein J5I93_13260 [Pirellulaceae bacterium]|nr:hypothetical protein [Pirellulaceae bacterium]